MGKKSFGLKDKNWWSVMITEQHFKG